MIHYQGFSGSEKPLFTFMMDRPLGYGELLEGGEKGGRSFFWGSWHKLGGIRVGFTVFVEEATCHVVLDVLFR